MKKAYNKRSNAAYLFTKKINISKRILAKISNIYKKKVAVLSFKKKFINLLMVHGKKSKASKIFNKAVNLLKKKLMKPKQKVLATFNKKVNREQLTLNKTIGPSSSRRAALEAKLVRLRLRASKHVKQDRRKPERPAMSSLVYGAILNVKPILEVRKVRIGRMTYQVPAIISKKRRETLAIRWIIESAKKRKTNSNLPFSESLAQELLEASRKQGQARQKRDSLHKLAGSNRIYLHYRWW